MDIQLINHTKDPATGSQYATLRVGNTEAIIGVTPDYISVCCKNAAHRVFRGLGRTFWGAGWNEVLAGYKSREMREIIQAVQRLTEEGSGYEDKNA